jgi:hypothetical protein
MAATKLDAKLAKILEPHGELMSVVYFEVDGGRIVDREKDSPYELDIMYGPAAPQGTRIKLEVGYAAAQSRH